MLTKLRSSIDFRSTFSKELFKTELLGVSQSLAKTTIELYYTNKSDVLSVFTTCDMLLTGPSAAILIELSPLVQTHDLIHCRTDLALALYSRISKTAAGCIQVDVITDRYFNNSLKEGTEELVAMREQCLGISTIMMRYPQISKTISSKTA